MCGIKRSIGNRPVMETVFNFPKSQKIAPVLASVWCFRDFPACSAAGAGSAGKTGFLAVILNNLYNTQVLSTSQDSCTAGKIPTGKCSKSSIIIILLINV